MKFEEFNLHEDILRGINDAGFDEAMPAQEKTFNAVLNGKDVTVQSQTGTGKTAAFLISIYQLFKTDVVENKKALIVVPTRELAVQIEEEAEILGKYLDYKTVSIYGGVGYKQQLEKLKAGADFIVGTPGRLLDLEKSNHIDYKQFGVLVIDEADRLFDMGFFPDLRKMLRKLVDPTKRRTMLFSATLNTRVLNLAWDQMNEYEEIKIEPEKVTVEEITQELYHVAANEKMKLLLGILKKENFENAIIFCNTKNKVAEVSKRLDVNGYKTKFLMGDLPQKKRLATINDMKAGELDILVATDVAARGLHVDDLSLVVNFDLPEDYENYVHRIGRTARAGKTGKAVSLACPKYVYHLPAIESYIGDKISVMIADDESFLEDASEGMRFRNEYDDRPQRGRSGDNRGGGKRSDGRRDGGRGGYNRSGDNRGGGNRSDGNRGDGRRKDSGNRNGGNRNNSGSRSGGDRSGGNRNRRNDEYRNNRSRPAVELKRPTADAGVEDRIAYYKAKYGEDFKPSAEMLKQNGAGGSKKTGGRKSGNRNKSGQSHGGKQQGGQSRKPQQADKGNKKPQQKAQQKAPDAAAPKKSGFLGRLFGKK
ncbi:MAG: DEAD/DEAH box helicase [Spirochaetales bacterium]|uniref:DEAD/DEAH box helicase n=1 Tax=Candidatus Thalassospirochaeta sargassi TaxID=3119039 RepID=A0AAJ1MLU4_9SPIO|nr:DEAD/DEAH box helicase [Spirochaetales bacterium]